MCEWIYARNSFSRKNNNQVLNPPLDTCASVCVCLCFEAIFRFLIFVEYKYGVCLVWFMKHIIKWKQHTLTHEISSFYIVNFLELFEFMLCMWLWKQPLLPTFISIAIIFATKIVNFPFSKCFILTNYFTCLQIVSNNQWTILLMIIKWAFVYHLCIALKYRQKEYLYIHIWGAHFSL